MTKSLATPDSSRTLSRFAAARICLDAPVQAFPQRRCWILIWPTPAPVMPYTPLGTAVLGQEIERCGLSSLSVQSQAMGRAVYLHHPDLGRRLYSVCVKTLHPKSNSERRLSIVLADGLSSLAPAQHALPLLGVLKPQLAGWDLDAIVLATQARVALGGEIGSLRGAEAVVILIGERPGLIAADSLGAYVTYKPTWAARTRNSTASRTSVLPGCHTKMRLTN